MLRWIIKFVLIVVLVVCAISFSFIAGIVVGSFERLKKDCITICALEYVCVEGSNPDTCMDECLSGAYDVTVPPPPRGIEKKDNSITL